MKKPNVGINQIWIYDDRGLYEEIVIVDVAVHTCAYVKSDGYNIKKWVKKEQIRNKGEFLRMKRSLLQRVLRYIKR